MHISSPPFMWVFGYQTVITSTVVHRDLLKTPRLGTTTEGALKHAGCVLMEGRPRENILPIWLLYRCQQQSCKL